MTSRDYPTARSRAMRTPADRKAGEEVASCRPQVVAGARAWLCTLDSSPSSSRRDSRPVAARRAPRPSQRRERLDDEGARSVAVDGGGGKIVKEPDVQSDLMGLSDSHAG
jgi:hypothetical protein